MAAVGLDELKASLLLLMADCSITSLELRSPKACISPKLWDLASLLQRRDSDDDEQHTRTLRQSPQMKSYVRGEQDMDATTKLVIH